MINSNESKAMFNKYCKCFLFVLFFCGYAYAGSIENFSDEKCRLDLEAKLLDKFQFLKLQDQHGVLKWDREIRYKVYDVSEYSGVPGYIDLFNSEVERIRGSLGIKISEVVGEDVSEANAFIFIVDNYETFKGVLLLKNFQPLFNNPSIPYEQYREEVERNIDGYVKSGIFVTRGFDGEKSKCCNYGAIVRMNENTDVKRRVKADLLGLLIDSRSNTVLPKWAKIDYKNGLFSQIENDFIKIIYSQEIIYKMAWKDAVPILTKSILDKACGVIKHKGN